MTQRQLARGARLVELLKQPQYAPMPVEQQVAGIFAVSNGLADEVPVEQIRKWERDMMAYLQSKAGDVLDEIRTKKAMNDDLNARLKGAIEKFKPTFIAG